VNWQSKETYLPPEFHSAKPFNRLLKILKGNLKDPFFLNGNIDAPLLLLGRMYQEVCRAMEIEPDAPTKLPHHLVNSPFGIKEMKKIDNLLKTVHLPSKQ
jgi:hypothetical protein